MDFMIAQLAFILLAVFAAIAFVVMLFAKTLFKYVAFSAVLMLILSFLFPLQISVLITYAQGMVL